MLEKKTVREMINGAIELYNSGEWNAAIVLLTKAASHDEARLEELREIDVHIGWNLWKQGHKDWAAVSWVSACAPGSNEVIQASAHAGLGIYFAEKGDKQKALHHAKLAQDLLPENATMNQSMNLNACGISLAKIGELDRAKEVLKKVAKINEQLEKSDDLVIAKKAKHQRAKNGYNLASLVYIPQKKYEEAIKELNTEVTQRYVKVGAETDLAAAYHRLSEAYELIEKPGIYDGSAKLDYALHFEQLSLNLWQKHPDDPKRVETAEKNTRRLKEKIEKLKQ